MPAVKRRAKRDVTTRSPTLLALKSADLSDRERQEERDKETERDRERTEKDRERERAASIDGGPDSK